MSNYKAKKDTLDELAAAANIIYPSTLADAAKLRLTEAIADTDAENAKLWLEVYDKLRQVPPQ